MMSDISRDEYRTGRGMGRVRIRNDDAATKAVMNMRDNSPEERAS